MAGNFEEKSGLVTMETPWGSWGQTVEDVLIEINVDEGTRSKDVKCNIDCKQISVFVLGKSILQGSLYDTIVKDESIWTLEDKKIIRIVLNKVNRDASKCWKSLFSSGEYAVDPFTYQEMEKKLTLERFQIENPGFDFSKAEVTGNYHEGGPKFPR